jgi:large repetitive protein
MSLKSSLVLASCLLVLALALALTPSLVVFGPEIACADDPNAPGTAQWSSLGGDYGRSGSSENEALADGAVAWEQNTGGAVLSSVTIGSDGRIHAACEDGKLYTFDASGTTLWIADVNTPLLSAPSIGPDGSLFVGGQDGKLRAIASDGTLRWTYGTGDAVYSSPAVAADGNVYFGSSDGTLHALDADGSELWQFATKGPGIIPTGAIFASASLATDGTVYAAGLYDPNLYALNPADGSVKWACSFKLYPGSAADPEGPKTGGWPFASPVVGADGTVYQTLLYDSRLYAIEPEGGSILWATDLLDAPGIDPEAEDFDADADGWSEPTLGPDGTIYVSLDDPYLRAVDPNGAIKWGTKLGDVGAFTLTVDARGWIYAACDDGYVYVVDNDGLQIGRWETSGWPIYPVIATDGTVLVGDSKDYSMLIAEAQNTVQALSIESLQDPAPEPEPEPEPEPDPGLIRR